MIDTKIKLLFVLTIALALLLAATTFETAKVAAKLNRLAETVEGMSPK